jgi:hypothetical protein
MPNTDVKSPLDLDLGSVIQGPETVQVPANLAEIAICPAEELVDDEITIAIKEDDPPEAVLKAILGGMAEEENSLRQHRQQKTKEGKDTINASRTRAQILKFMAETKLQQQAIVGGTGEIDLRSPKFREIFRMFLTTVSETFDESKIPPEYREIFFHALKKNLEGWEERAERIIKAMTPKITI